MNRTRTIKVDYLARVEGEGALYVKIKGNRAEDVRLQLFAPPPSFEAFLRGRPFAEPRATTAGHPATWPGHARRGSPPHAE